MTIGETSQVSILSKCLIHVTNRLRKQDCIAKIMLIQYIFRLWFYDNEITNVCKEFIIYEKIGLFAFIGRL